MLGIGTWEFPVSMMGYRGNIQMDIIDNGGRYGFALRVPGQQVPPFTVRSVRQNGNTLHITARTPRFGSRDISVSVTFNGVGGTASGAASAPFIGTIRLNNGRMVR